MMINIIILAIVQHLSIRFLNMSVMGVIEKWNYWQLDSEQPAVVGKSKGGRGVV